LSRTYSIRDLTGEFGITARTVRFYETDGLLAPVRRGQARVYTERDRARLKLILRGKRVGFTLAEIKEGFDLYDLDRGGPAHMAYLQRKFAERIASLERQRADLDAVLGELRLGLSAIDTRLGELESDDGARRPRLIGFGMMPAEGAEP